MRFISKSFVALNSIRTSTTKQTSLNKQILLLIGIVAGLLAGWFLPDGYHEQPGDILSKTIPVGMEARITTGLAVTMAIWWMTEAIPVYATALLPILILPLTNARTFDEATGPYANKLIYLFLGGFVLALAMQKTGLHRRLALSTLRFTGSRPLAIVAGFMFITAAMSMWVSNTATTMMMMPIAISLISVVNENQKDEAKKNSLATCLLLSIAYSASIGGLGTIIGSPPNAFAASFVAESLGREISFINWMLVGIPVVFVLLPIVWWILACRMYRLDNRPIPGGDALFQAELEKLGPTKNNERVVLWLFILTAALWIFRPMIQNIEFVPPISLKGLSDTGIALAAALLLFAMPNFDCERNAKTASSKMLLDWHSMKELPWGVLLLIGGGLSLAKSVEATGVSALLADQLGVLNGAPSWLILLAIILLVVFLTELTSNLATVAAMTALLPPFADSLGIDVMILLIPAAMAGSCAFMLPVATPPNAIVYGSGHITTPQMVKAGIGLNAVATLVLLATGMTLVRWIFG